MLKVAPSAQPQEDPALSLTTLVHNSQSAALNRHSWLAWQLFVTQAHSDFHIMNWTAVQDYDMPTLWNCQAVPLTELITVP